MRNREVAVALQLDYSQQVLLVLTLLVIVVGNLSAVERDSRALRLSLHREDLYRRGPELPLANEFNKNCRRAAAPLVSRSQASRPTAPPAAGDPFAKQARDERAAILARGLTRKVAASRDVFEKYQAPIRNSTTYDFGLAYERQSARAGKHVCDPRHDGRNRASSTTSGGGISKAVKKSG